MRGWIVLYAFGDFFLITKHYKTEKQAHRFAEQHRQLGVMAKARYDAVVVNVEEMVAWVNSGREELERLFRL